MGNMPLLVLFICLLVYLVRLVLVSLTGTTILVVTVMLPFCTEYNIHPFMIAIIAYMATNTWNVSYQNTQMIAALAATDNKVCSNRDILGGSVLYMITVVVGCMLALPVWKFMGLY